MTKRLASHTPVMEVVFTRSLTSQLTSGEGKLKYRQDLSRYFRSRAMKTWRVQVVGEGIDLEGEEACGLSAD